jgi:hypothetical protein
MSTSSPAYVEPQFTTYDGQISNLDRCNRCGTFRSAHGPDWTCPASLRPVTSVIPLTAGAVLTLTGALWLAITPDAPPRDVTVPPSLAVMALLAGITLVVMGLAMLRGLRK